MAMAKFMVDTVAKLFIAKAGVTSFNVKIDLYSDAKEHWLLGGVAMGFDFPLEGVGGQTTSGVNQIPLYCFLRNGWRVRPAEANHTLDVTDGILVVKGGGDPFVDTLAAFTVRINYQQPVQAIAVAGSSPLTAVQADQLSEVHENRGLVVGNPVIRTADGLNINSGNISQVVTVKPDSTVELERQ